MTTTPIVALQKPKGISLDEIEAELSQIWRSQSGEKGNHAATRATTFTMVVYEPEEFQQTLGALGFYDGPIDGIYGPKTKEAVRQAQIAYGLRVTGRIDSESLERLRAEMGQRGPTPVTNLDQRGFNFSSAIAAQNPCRVITLCPQIGVEEGISVQVSAYCPVQKQSGSRLICCEYISLRGDKQSLGQTGDLIESLMIADLPKFVWWKATPNPEQDLFKRLAEACNCLILDSSYFSDPESEFLKMQELIESETYVADLNWHRLSPWQELAAAAFDPPERRQALVEIDRVTIDYEKGNAAQALMYLGWLASRLGWQPMRYTESVENDYELSHIWFEGPGDRPIEAELAAVPTADWGEVSGDLIALRLASTNPDADCGTILCSETTGCMRMEAGGSAQSSRTEQVTALSDQKAEFLLGQQLQRWGRDFLYEESLAVTAQMLRLRSQE